MLLRPSNVHCLQRCRVDLEQLWQGVFEQTRMVEKCGEHTLAANEEEKMLLVKYRERRIAVVFVDAHGSFTNTTEGLIRG